MQKGSDILFPLQKPLSPTPPRPHPTDPKRTRNTPETEPNGPERTRTERNPAEMDRNQALSGGTAGGVGFVGLGGGLQRKKKITREGGVTKGGIA